MKFKLTKQIIIFASLIVGLLVIDMMSKVFTNGIDHTRIIPKVIAFESVHNEGIAFSWLSGAGIWLIVLVGILTVGAITAWWFFGRKNTFASVAFSFFVAGAIGNLYDRIAYGHVRDFIKFDFWQSFAIFNFADICLTSGTVMLMIYFIFVASKKKKEKTTENIDEKTT